MSGEFAWVKSAATRLSDQRQEAGWRPATVEAASFSSRAMRVLRALQGVEHAAHSCLPRDAVGSTEHRCSCLVAYLIVWTHELDVSGLDPVARMSRDELMDVNPHQAPGEITKHVRDAVTEAWDLWANDDTTEATRHLHSALCRTLAMCMALGVDVTEDFTHLDLNTRRPGSRHPDTW